MATRQGSSDGPVWVGVDIGTQSVRVAAVAADGEVVGSGSAPLQEGRTSGPRHEQSPKSWWNALGTAAQAATADLRRDRVRSAAFCGTSGTFLLADRRGRPLTPALMYNDARAEEEAAEVDAAGRDVWRRLGYTMQRSWALPKLLRLLREKPGHADPAAVRMQHQVDHLVSRLVGHPVAADSSHALKTGYDTLGEAWPVDVLDRLGIDPRILPDVVHPGTVLGRVDARGAEHTGLPEDTPIVAGMTDGCAAQIAAGALTPGHWNSVLGTTLVLKGVTGELLLDPSGAMYCHRHPDGGRWLPGGASNTGAGAIAARFPGRDPAEMDAAAARRETVNGVIYPLTARGERFPFVRHDAEPFETGEFADDVDRYAALLHGVSYIERLCFEHLRHLGAAVDRVSLTGGGARSRYWSQVRADVLGIPLTVPAHPEPSSGMAVLAAAYDPDETRGGDRAIRTAERMVRVREVVDPRPDGRERFRDGYRSMVTELDRRGYLPEHLSERPDT